MCPDGSATISPTSATRSRRAGLHQRASRAARLGTPRRRWRPDRLASRSTPGGRRAARPHTDAGLARRQGERRLRRSRDLSRRRPARHACVTRTDPCRAGKRSRPPRRARGGLRFRGWREGDRGSRSSATPRRGRGGAWTPIKNDVMRFAAPGRSGAEAGATRRRGRVGRRATASSRARVPGRRRLSCSEPLCPPQLPLRPALAPSMALGSSRSRRRRRLRHGPLPEPLRRGRSFAAGSGGQDRGGLSPALPGRPGDRGGSTSRAARTRTDRSPTFRTSSTTTCARRGCPTG